MVKFDLDVLKMPLGKIEHKQIDNGFIILMEIANRIKKEDSEAALVQASNIFYSYIPHKVSSEDTITSKRYDHIKTAFRKSRNAKQLESHEIHL